MSFGGGVGGRFGLVRGSDGIYFFLLGGVVIYVIPEVEQNDSSDRSLWTLSSEARLSI